MSKPRLLDLFSGAGGASMGYHRAGFEVVGDGIVPQPRYPFEFHQADALTFPLDGFDVIAASPPCQAHTTLRVMYNARKHVDLVPATRARLQASGLPYVIENVVGAPLKAPIVLCGTMFQLGVEVYDGWRDLRRHRLFESNIAFTQPKCEHGKNGTIGIYGDHARDRRRKPGVRACGIDFPDCDLIALGRAAMDMPWCDWKGLSQAIPPAYTQWIGEQIMRTLVNKAVAA